MDALVMGGVNPSTISGRDGRWEMGDGREEIECKQWLLYLGDSR